MFRAVELLRDQLAPPVEDRLGFCNLRYCGQALASEPLADFCQRAPLCIGQTEPPWQMRSQNPVLGRKILDLKQELLIYEPKHVREQAGHLVTLHTARIFSGLSRKL